MYGNRVAANFPFITIFDKPQHIMYGNLDFLAREMYFLYR